MYLLIEPLAVIVVPQQILIIIFKITFLISFDIKMTINNISLFAGFIIHRA